uniref:TRAP transporter TatT component family protein n=1 Tax=Nitrospira cf. moscoviensis SBR1015 TaxID=96242 RepID=UPI00112488D5|nr:TRAP transporter TatT component family protein [Nitrospira cf. moscoviensis SBR1015]
MMWTYVAAMPRDARRPGPFSLSAVLLVVTVFLSGCSVKRLAADVVGDALTGDSESFASDDDPDLIREAIPFGLKTIESFLASSPSHRGLLLSAAKGFTTYAYLLQDEADRLEEQDRGRARLLRARIKRLYLRGREYAFRGLELDHPRFESLLRRDQASVLAKTTGEDAPFLYWAGVSWGGALSAGSDDLALVSEAPLFAALVRRVVDVHERYEGGAAHEFLISYETSRPGGSAGLAREHFRRALALTDTPRASLFVALAEGLSIKEQHLDEFKALLERALAVDPDRESKGRLVNVLAQRRARWLLARIPELFLDIDHREVAP